MRISIIFSTIYIAGLVFLIMVLTLPAVALLSALPQFTTPPIHSVSLAPKVFTTEISVDGFTVPVDTYQTATFSYGQLVLFPGAVEDSREDPRVKRLADSFSRAGLTVHVAGLQNLSRYQIRPEVITEMKAVILHVNERSTGAPPQVMSFSLGVGPLLIAAADPKLAGKIDRIIGFGGYFDLKELLAFHRAAPEADPFGRLVIENFLSEVSEREKTEFFNIFDPRPHLKNLRAEILLLHSRRDTAIPFEQSRKLAAALKQQSKQVKLIGLELFTHVSPELPRLTVSNFFQIYLPEFWRLYQASFTILYN